MVKVVHMTSKAMCDALRAMGIEPNETVRVVIDMNLTDPYTVYVQRYADEKVIDLLAILGRQETVRRDPDLAPAAAVWVNGELWAVKIEGDKVRTVCADALASPEDLTPDEAHAYADALRKAAVAIEARRA